MKYMHFNSSCSYTALAMLLEEKGINTEDTEIALEIGLPRIFEKKDDCFLTGPNLQGAEWFDVYLKPRGLRMAEEYVNRENIPEYLIEHGTCMLGIKLPENKGKHAVVFNKYDGSYHFYNPVREGSEGSTEIVFDKAGLLSAVEQETMVGMVVECPRTEYDMQPVFKKSLSVLKENLEAIEIFCCVFHEAEEYKAAMDRIFRSILLDGISMLEIAGEKDLAENLRKLQKEYLQFLMGDKKGILADHISLPELRKCGEKYMLLIEEHIKKKS